MKTFIFFVIFYTLRAEAGTYYRAYQDSELVHHRDSPEPEGETHWSFEFDKVMWIRSKTINSTWLQIDIIANNNGFVGFGFSPKANVSTASDIVFAGVDDTTNEVYNFDYHVAEGSFSVTEDLKGESDWVLISSSNDLSQNNTKLTFQRLLKTTDPNPNQDLEIKNEDVYISWFFGESDNITEDFSKQGRSQECNLLKDGARERRETGGGSKLINAPFTIFLSVVTLNLLRNFKAF